MRIPNEKVRRGHMPAKNLRVPKMRLNEDIFEGKNERAGPFKAWHLSLNQMFNVFIDREVQQLFSMANT